MSCRTCNDLQTSPSNRSDSLNIPIDDCFRSASKTSCDTCQLLCDIVEHFQHDGNGGDVVTIRRKQDTHGMLSVSIYADLDEDDVILDVFVPEGEESGHPLITSSPRARTVQYSSAEDECLERLRSWIDDCDEEHTNCNFDMMPLPTRVINVGLDGETPFLWETNGACEWYATLSYCWGKLPQLKTTKARLEEFKKELPMEELSMTALDAIEICQKLLIPYLWIDALCIVQDDEEDWQREAGRMCDIYSSSYLTIAAAGSADSADGIYQAQRLGGSQRLMNFEFRGQEVWARVNPFQDHLGHPLGLNFDEQYDDQLKEKSWILRPDELPLVHRAWTVQERILSRRVVYHTPEEMWWECDSQWRCECGFSDEEKYPKNRDHAAFIGSLSAVQEANRGAFEWLRDATRLYPLTLEKVYHKWNTITTMFAAGNLTYATDKLPALHGLAQQFKTMLQSRFNFHDEYCAGMWRYNFERQLLWVVSGHILGAKPLAPRPTGTSIPTWSWLSVTGNVQHISDEEDMNFRPRFRIVQFDTPPMGADQMMSKGKLVLEAFVVHNMKVSSAQQRPEDRIVQVRTSSSAKSFQVSRDIAGVLSEGPFSCLYAADLDATEGSLERPNREVGGMFMLLKPVENAENAFERVGMGIAALPSMMEGLWDGATKQIISIV